MDYWIQMWSKLKRKWTILWTYWWAELMCIRSRIKVLLHWKHIFLVLCVLNQSLVWMIDILCDRFVLLQIIPIEMTSLKVTNMWFGENWKNNGFDYGIQVDNSSTPLLECDFSLYSYSYHTIRYLHTKNISLGFTICARIQFK